MALESKSGLPEERKEFEEILLDEDFREEKSSTFLRFLAQILKIKTSNFCIYEFLCNQGPREKRPYIYKRYQERMEDMLIKEMNLDKGDGKYDAIGHNIIVF